MIIIKKIIYVSAICLLWVLSLILKELYGYEINPLIFILGFILTLLGLILTKQMVIVSWVIINMFSLVLPLLELYKLSCQLLFEAGDLVSVIMPWGMLFCLSFLAVFFSWKLITSRSF
jgi:hypothetical protein